MLGRRLPWTAFAALTGALIIHYLVYAFRFMWYLDAANYDLLIHLYMGFVVVVVMEFIVYPKGWLMAATAAFAMVMPVIVGVQYVLPVGFGFIFVVALSGLPFVGVALLRDRWIRTMGRPDGN